MAKKCNNAFCCSTKRTLNLVITKIICFYIHAPVCAYASNTYVHYIKIYIQYIQKTNTISAYYVQIKFYYVNTLYLIHALSIDCL